MSTQYNGIPSNLSGLVPETYVNISSSTNASPIVVTTSSAHGLETGDDTFIYGHRVNTNANGKWTVTVLSSTTFSLNGSTGNGVGAATGVSQSLALGPSFQIPADGDDFDAAAFDVPYEALGDRTTFGYEYAFPVVEWGMIKRAPFKIVNQASAVSYHLNIGIANRYQIMPQSVGLTFVLDIASYPPLDGSVIEIMFDAQTQNISYFNEGGSDGAIVSAVGGGWLKFRFNKSLGFWKIIGASTVDGSKMIFSTPF